MREKTFENALFLGSAYSDIDDFMSALCLAISSQGFGLHENVDPSAMRWKLIDLRTRNLFTAEIHEVRLNTHFVGALLPA